MLESGYVRLYRSLLNWEWYTDTNTKAVFLHLILTANWEPKKWRGITIERGQRVFSYAKLAAEIRLSVQSVRTAINHLKSTGEITCSGTAEYSVVTVKNYDFYQQPTSELTNDQQASNKPSTSDQQQLKKDKESNKDNKDKYSAVFTAYAGDDAELLKALFDFAEMRKAIKKPLSTERAAKMLTTSLDKLAKDNKTKIAILNQSVFKNWQGVFPLKEGDSNARQTSNDESNNGARAGESAQKVPKYGTIL